MAAAESRPLERDARRRSVEAHRAFGAVVDVERVVRLEARGDRGEHRTRLLVPVRWQVLHRGDRKAQGGERRGERAGKAPTGEDSNHGIHGVCDREQRDRHQKEDRPPGEGIDVRGRGGQSDRGGADEDGREAGLLHGEDHRGQGHEHDHDRAGQRGLPEALHVLAGRGRQAVEPVDRGGRGARRPEGEHRQERPEPRPAAARKGNCREARAEAGEQQDRRLRKPHGRHPGERGRRQALSRRWRIAERQRQQRHQRPQTRRPSSTAWPPRCRR